MHNLIRVGITGQQGFIGRNLAAWLAKQSHIRVVPSDRQLFDNEKHLRDFVSNCDAIVHLAAISRHDDGAFMYETNLRLVRQLITAMENARVTPHVLFGATTHTKDTPYHASKRDGRRLLDEWAARSGGRHTCLLIPNTFGPYGKPYYNSVVSTFCHKIAHGETPEIIADAPVQLIYIDELCREIYRVINGETTGSSHTPPYQYEVQVSAILSTLQELDRDTPTDTDNSFRRDLLTTLRHYQFKA